MSGDLDAALLHALEHAALKDIASAYLAEIDSGACGLWRPDEDIYPASVIKVAIMAEAFHQFAHGLLDPKRRVVVSQANQTTTAEATPLLPGYEAAVAELVDLMITRSDNVATNQLMDVLRREKVTEYMRSLGLATFLLGRKLSGSEPLIEDREVVGRNRLPAGEIGWLLRLIATDSVPGAAAQREILNRCVHNDKLVPGLAPGDRFMHKTGETGDTSHDAGILHTAAAKRYVVVVYTAPPSNPDGSDASHINPQMTQFMRTLRPSL
ncbi:MAG: class A beta-lactamase-related serine hydrolase [Candidatus Eremiobacteraeota bacterium]|nr:class A beta-lactamase-related serine hydrolase [Candidatus Eremiobacteraeota bacterium]